MLYKDVIYYYGIYSLLRCYLFAKCRTSTLLILFELFLDEKRLVFV